MKVDYEEEEEDKSNGKADVKNYTGVAKIIDPPPVRPHKKFIS